MDKKNALDQGALSREDVHRYRRALAAYFKNLVETAGFSIEDECWTWEGRAYSVLVRKTV